MGQDTTPSFDLAQQTEDDPWALAFEAVNKKEQEDPEAAANGDGDPQKINEGNVSDPTSSDRQDESDSTAENGNAVRAVGEGGHDNDDQPGGADRGAGEDRDADDDVHRDIQSVSVEELEELRSGLDESVRDRAIQDVANEFIKQGIRHTNGKLGATVNDPDICKYDEDHMPHFYNPDTGREFTGDNPRYQAQQWVDGYNKELADAFNQACAGYSEKLKKEYEPFFGVLEFAPKFDQLDPVRKSMLREVIDDYQVLDSNGDIIGYSCDLDVALACVNRQVSAIQEYYKATHPSNEPADKDEPSAPSGPALDMKNSVAAAAQEKRAPQSLAEAMEMEQDRLLAKIREGK